MVCEEYVPSKVYEYLLTGRPLLALTAESSELAQIVTECGHQVASPDNAHAIAETIIRYIKKWQNNSLQESAQVSPYTIKRTVDTLLAVSKEIQ